MVVMTDRKENASREFSFAQLREMIKERTAVGRAFVFLRRGEVRMRSFASRLLVIGRIRTFAYLRNALPHRDLAGRGGHSRPRSFVRVRPDALRSLALRSEPQAGLARFFRGHELSLKDSIERYY